MNKKQMWRVMRCIDAETFEPRLLMVYDLNRHYYQQHLMKKYGLPYQEKPIKSYEFSFLTGMWSQQ